MEFSMEEANSLEVLTPADQGESLDVEDVLEPEAELEEIGEAQASAPSTDLPWDNSPPEPAKAEKEVAAQPSASPFAPPSPQAGLAEPPVQVEEELAAEELTIESGEEVAEELPVALTEEESAEASVELAEEMAAEAPELSAEEVSAEAPELSPADVSEEERPEPGEAVSAEAPELSAEEVSVEAEPEPEQAPVMRSEEVVAEAQFAKVGEVVTEAPRPPVDLGELPPVPEEPMQLAATWEFMGMAESQVSSTPTAREERALELDTSLPAMPDYTGSPQDEVALAPTWDFVPQWQPQEEPAKSEPSAPSAPPVLEEPAPAESPASSQELTTTSKYGSSSVQPAMTGKYGTVSAEPEPPRELGLGSDETENTGLYGVVSAEPPAAEAQESVSAALTTTDKYGIGSGEPARTGQYGTVDAELVTTGKFGIGFPEPSSTGMHGTGAEASAAPVAQPEPGEDLNWDQLISGAEPELPGPNPFDPPAEPDPFAEFAAEAARASPAPAPAPGRTSAPGARPPWPTGSSGEGSQE